MAYRKQRVLLRARCGLHAGGAGLQRQHGDQLLLAPVDASLGPRRGERCNAQRLHGCDVGALAGAQPGDLQHAATNAGGGQVGAESGAVVGVQGGHAIEFDRQRGARYCGRARQWQIADGQVTRAFDRVEPHAALPADTGLIVERGLQRVVATVARQRRELFYGEREWCQRQPVAPGVGALINQAQAAGLDCHITQQDARHRVAGRRVGLGEGVDEALPVERAVLADAGADFRAGEVQPVDRPRQVER